MIFLDNDEVNDWYDLLHEDAINPYDIDSSSNERDGFTIMHEIGHIRLGHKEESDLADKMANHYAGFSLVPSPLYELLGCNSMEDIVDTFGVSDECAFICYKRCENCPIPFGVSIH